MCYCLWLGSGICPPRTIPLGPELSDLIKELKENRFYVTQANKLANTTEEKVQKENTDEVTILANALKIFICKI